MRSPVIVALAAQRPAPFPLGSPVAIRVQGGYWHGPTFHERTIEDQQQADRLRAQGYIVLDLWEQDIYDAVRFDRLDAYIRNEL